MSADKRFPKSKTKLELPSRGKDGYWHEPPASAGALRRNAVECLKSELVCALCIQAHICDGENVRLQEKRQYWWILGGTGSGHMPSYNIVPLCPYINHYKVEIWSGVTDNSQTKEYRATQLV